MNTHNDYQATDPIRLRAYGRHLQNLAIHVTKLKDKTERTQQAKQLISIMQVINPQNGISPSDQKRLWDDLVIMSDYQLDIDAPYPLTQKITLANPPAKVPYRQNKKSPTPYGSYISAYIQLLKEITDPQLQTVLLIDILRIITSPQKYNQGIEPALNHIKQIMGKELIANLEQIKEKIKQPHLQNIHKSRGRYRYTSHKSRHQRPRVE